MKTRLLCVLVLLNFAMGCKDDKKKDTDDDEKESTEQSTESGEQSTESGEQSTESGEQSTESGEQSTEGTEPTGEAGDEGGEPPASAASCGEVYDHMLKINGTEGALPKSQFVAICETESTPEQRACLIAATSEESMAPCFALGIAPAIPDIDAKLKNLDEELAIELLKAKEDFKVDMENSEKDFEVEMKKIEAEIEGMR